MEAQKSPFPGISPHLSPTRVKVRTWFVEPAGMCNQIEAGTHINGALATYVSEHVYNLMRSRFPLATRYLFIHDFSGAVSYDTAGRQIFTQWALRVRSQIENVFVIIPPSNSVFQMGINTVAMMLRLSGIPFEVIKSVDEIRDRYKIKPCGEAQTP